jgi:DNA gyrase subunit B
LACFQVDDVQVEVALQWCSDSFSDTIVGFVNSIKTIDGGTHMDGALFIAPSRHI